MKMSTSISVLVNRLYEIISSVCVELEDSVCDIETERNITTTTFRSQVDYHTFTLYVQNSSKIIKQIISRLESLEKEETSFIISPILQRFPHKPHKPYKLQKKEATYHVGISVDIMHI